MNFRNIIRPIPLAIALFATAVSTDAAGLPTRNVNGRECYYYEVQPKETIFGICKGLGITKSQIVQHNPAVADGLRAGETLYFPVDDFPELGNVNATSSDERKVEMSRTDSKTETATIYQKGAVHHVAKGETVYGICKHYGISEDELIALNPQLKNGLKHGSLLILPDSLTAAEADAPALEAPVVVALPDPKPEVVVQSVNSEPVNAPLFLSASTEPEPETLPEPEVEPVDSLLPSPETVEPVVTVDTGSSKIALILPFMLDNSSVDKQAQLHTEFLKGFLLAADSLRNADRKIEILAYDSAGSLDSVVNILNREELDDVNVIITPDDDDQFDAIARFARERNAAVFNVFAVKNEGYLHNPDILQANISHAAVYSKAIKEFLRLYNDFTPVFLTSREGKTDKHDFTSLLRKALADDGRQFIELPYTTYLKESDLSSLDPEGAYVFIPESGAAAEFNHIAGALKTLRENQADYNKVKLFGYPEWITFRGNALENLHFLDAMVYSRFYNDETSYRSKQLADKFKSVYGSTMISAVPVQGILGFDAGFYLLKSLNQNHGDILSSRLYYDGVQSGFHFTGNDDNDAGKVNDTLYFIEFRPSGLIDKHPVE